MTHSANPAQALDNVHRLLGHPSDLKGHLDAHGPLNVALGRNGSWQQGLMASLEAFGPDRSWRWRIPHVDQAGARPIRTAPAGPSWSTRMEGEPASDKDALLLTRAPHLVLDGAQYLAAMCRADRIVVCIPIGRDYVAAAVNQAIRERAEEPLRAGEGGDRPAARPLHRRRGVGPGQLDRVRHARSRSSGRTRAHRFASAGAPHWCTTPRPWRTSP